MRGRYGTLARPLVGQDYWLWLAWGRVVELRGRWPGTKTQARGAAALKQLT